MPPVIVAPVVHSDMMSRNVAEAIRQQSEDLRDELKGLEEWEVEMKKKNILDGSKPRSGSSAPHEVVEPPIRGTVPSIKDAMLQESKKGGKTNSLVPGLLTQAKEKGNEYFRLGKIQEAVEAYTAGIQQDPHSSTAHVLYANRAMCYIKQKKWETAEKDATTCLLMNTGYAKAYFRRAIARKNLGKLREARTDLEAVLALIPSDASATSEMELVTRMLQAERSAASSAQPAKKRIVIQEVEDEDEDNGEAGTNGDGAGVSAVSNEEALERQKRIDAQMREVEEARQRREEMQRQEALQAELRQAQRRRCNNRVEIIEEDEADGAAERPKVKHQDPVQSDLKEMPSVSSPPKGCTTSPVTSLPSPRRPRPPIAIENLKAPKSFSDFERTFSEVEQYPELRDHYTSLLPPSTLPSILGSNLTPEMLVGLLKSLRSLNGTAALQLAMSLSQVRRVEDITLFFDKEEKMLVQEVLDFLKSKGATEKDLTTLRRKLNPS